MGDEPNLGVTSCSDILLKDEISRDLFISCAVGASRDVSTVAEQENWLVAAEED
jgi:hypothetical protein